MKKWDWLRDLMKKNNISQQQAAEALQWKKPRISELLGGKRDLPVNKVFLAAKFFNLDLEELTKYNSGFSSKIPAQGKKLPSSATNGHTVFIKIIDSSMTKGKGLAAVPVNCVPIDDDLLKDVGISAGSDLKIVIVHGDAMSPTINDRDMTLVDTSVSAPQNDGMYLFETKGELFVKRVCFNQFDKSIDIISDNPLYPPINIKLPNKLSCLGKVVAIGKLCK